MSAPGLAPTARRLNPDRAERSGTSRASAGSTGLTSQSEAWLTGTPLAKRKALGQFMTRDVIRQRLLDLMSLESGMRVLDPGVGTGEFLLDCARREPSLELTGWDVDEDIAQVARAQVPGATIEVRSALDPYEGHLFDVVIGNPPYFQVKLDKDARQHFAAVISGRPNIFSLFFAVAFSVVRPGGLVGYVVPTSMNAGSYFDALREHIIDRSEIIALESVDDHFAFADAQAPVQLIVMRVGAKSDRFIFRRQIRGKEKAIFNARPDLLAAEFVDRPTLADLGFKATTGPIVWNQQKEALRREEEPEAVRLLWARDIKNDGSLKEAGQLKSPSFVITDRKLVGPAIVVNRIVGAVGSGALRAALVPVGEEFTAENHVNVITAEDEAPNVSYEKLLSALLSPEISNRIRLLTGNTQISATELTHLLPLDI